MSSTLIKSHAVVCLDGSDQIYDKGAYLVVEDNRISEIGYQKNLPA